MMTSSAFCTNSTVYSRQIETRAQFVLLWKNQGLATRISLERLNVIRRRFRHFASNFWP